ncbi:MAG: membrane protein insertion efficiency factor YidD [Oscillospiraceae bacterium]|jgi:putative membrane protein insertion efficiency factor|nr:membrane protein insertion efficiency factor YidD [Oscillospiraceae bacterium]
MRRFLIFILKIYKKFISPMMYNRCRFYPSCSSYALLAIKKFGILKGGFLSIKRILRCNMFSKGGIDKLPKR